MKTCKSRVCDKKFKPSTPQSMYCSRKCCNRESYQLLKDRGLNTSNYVKKEKKTKECASRFCSNTFETTNDIKKYCCVQCSKREIQKVQTDKGYKRYKKKPKRELVCAYRNCQNEFTTSHNKAKYCSPACGKKELNSIQTDKNPNRVTYPGVLGRTKEIRFAIPKMSTQWLQDAWDAKCEREKEIA